MKKIEFVDQMSYDSERASSVEVSHNFPSVAIPDEDWTIDELLQRHRAGLLTDTGGVDYTDQEEDDSGFEDMVDLEKFRHMDLVDQETHLREARAAMDAYKRIVDERKAADDKVVVEKAARVAERKLRRKIEKDVRSGKAPEEGA